MYKYKIREMAASKGINHGLGKLICKWTGVTDATVSRWHKIDANSHQDIPSTHLRKIAHYLNCRMEDLFSQELEAA